MFLCIVSDRGCPWLLLSFLWLLLSCIWVLLDSVWFTVFCWYGRYCSLSPSLSINEMVFLGLWRLSFLYVFSWTSLLPLAFIGFSELVCSNLWNGFVLGVGCVVDLSVAPSFGEQPWLIASYSRHICPNGLRMKSPFSETFLDWLLHPSFWVDWSAFTFCWRGFWVLLFALFQLLAFHWDLWVIDYCIDVIIAELHCGVVWVRLFLLELGRIYFCWLWHWLLQCHLGGYGWSVVSWIFEGWAVFWFVLGAVLQLDLAKIDPTRKPDPNPPESLGF